MLEHIWVIKMNPLMVLMMEILKGNFLEVHWDLLMIKLVSTYDKVLDSDEGIKLGSTDGEVLEKILGNKISTWKA